MRPGPLLAATMAAVAAGCAPVSALVYVLATAGPDVQPPPVRPAAVLGGVSGSEPGFWGEIHPVAGAR